METLNESIPLNCKLTSSLTTSPYTLSSTVSSLWWVSTLMGTQWDHKGTVVYPYNLTNQWWVSAVIGTQWDYKSGLFLPYNLTNQFTTAEYWLDKQWIYETCTSINYTWKIWTNHLQEAFNNLSANASVWLYCRSKEPTMNVFNTEPIKIWNDWLGGLSVFWVDGWINVSSWSVNISNNMMGIDLGKTLTERWREKSVISETATEADNIEESWWSEIANPTEFQKVAKFMEEQTTRYEKVEFYIGTKAKKLDFIIIHVTQKNPKKFHDTKKSLPWEYIGTNEKPLPKKGLQRIFKSKVKISCIEN